MTKLFLGTERTSCVGGRGDPRMVFTRDGNLNNSVGTKLGIIRVCKIDRKMMSSKNIQTVS